MADRVYLRRRVSAAARRVGIDYWVLRRRVRGLLPGRRSRGADASWYDAVYVRQPEIYTQHYSESPYFPVWKEIGDRTPVGASVLEIGCGTGQLAHLLYDRGIRRYTGFDFSAEAVKIAGARLPEMDFRIADARTSSLLEESFDIVICTEVLEHVPEDLDVVRRVQRGARFIATVPDFDADSHVRWFSSIKEVESRYGQFFSRVDICIQSPPKMAGSLYILDGTKL